MQIIHALRNLRKRGEGQGHVLLADRHGFYAIGHPPVSDFDGLFCYDPDGHPFKILHEIRLSDRTPDAVINRFAWAERRSQGAHERILLSGQALIHEVERFEGELILTFDCKRLYDDDDRGRIYHIDAAGDDRLRIRYEKENAYGMTINLMAVPLDGKPQPSFRTIGKWRKVELPYDAVRGQRRERYVYDAAAVRVQGAARLVITYAHETPQADELLDATMADTQRIIQEICSQVKRFPEDIELAAAQNALGMLAQKQGLFAGLPWFFQYWARDELVSIGALLQLKEYDRVKETVQRWFREFADGVFRAHLVEGGKALTASIDAPGLLCLRTLQLLRMLGRQGIKKMFTNTELTTLRDQATAILNTLKRQRDLHGFLPNDRIDTWIDTTVEGDEQGRAGVRIEIQALLLAVFDLAIKLCELTGMRDTAMGIRKEREEHARMVKEWFYDKRGWLLDGFFPDGQADIRTRPNGFLAWYVAPDLLEKEEWVKAFDHALEQLWLPWGGIASLGTQDPLFQKHHTGIDNRSYHRGDSWFWINNIAALAMFAVDPHRYYEKIESLMAASCADLLYNGYAGCPSEISDAAALTARGCWDQAWSAGTLIELLLRMRSV